MFTQYCDLIEPRQYFTTTEEEFIILVHQIKTERHISRTVWKASLEKARGCLGVN